MHEPGESRGSPALRQLIEFCMHLTISPTARLQDYLAFINATEANGDYLFIQVYLDKKSNVIGSKEYYLGVHDLRDPPVDTQYVVVMATERNDVVMEGVPTIFTYGTILATNAERVMLSLALTQLLDQLGIPMVLPLRRRFDAVMITEVIHAINAALKDRASQSEGMS